VRKLTEIKGLRGASYRIGEFQKRAKFAVRGSAGYARLRLAARSEQLPISAVMVGRNDDYMPDFRERLVSTIEWNLKNGVAEIIFVEWNPPSDRELLAYDLVAKFDRLKVFVVSPELHHQICRNPKLPLLEYHAKNVGIKRAEMSWVLSTNADVALGLDLIAGLSKGTVDENIAWTAQRIDIQWSANRPIGFLDCVKYHRILPYDTLGSGDFVLASRKLWNRIGGYDESLVKHRIGCDIRGTAQMLAHGAEIRPAGSILHLAHPTSCTEGVQDHHGEAATLEGVPYVNREDWGLTGFGQTQLGERVWRIG
jgi:hypothetical protein